MLRKALYTCIVTTLFIGALLLIYFTIEKISAKRVYAEKISTIPAIELIGLDSAIFKVPLGKTIVFIFFDSTCDHCQYQTKSIQDSIDNFEDVFLVFISMQPLNEIRSYSSKYDLTNYSFVHFAQIKREVVFDLLGTIMFPHIFIYDREGRLIREFKGETKVGAIVKYLE